LIKSYPELVPALSGIPQSGDFGISNFFDTNEDAETSLPAGRQVQHDNVMVKFLIKIFFLLLFFNSAIAQEYNKTIIDEESGKPMLIGYCTRDVFKDTSFSWWYNSEYEMYELEYSTLDKLEGKLNSLEITIVLGTWCSDSREQIPRFLKILDELNFLEEKMTLIAVDRDKKWEEGEIENLNITLVPSIIFYKNGEELGRIEELPKETLEKDFAEIILNANEI